MAKGILLGRFASGVVEGNEYKKIHVIPFRYIPGKVTWRYRNAILDIPVGNRIKIARIPYPGCEPEETEMSPRDLFLNDSMYLVLSK